MTPPRPSSFPAPRRIFVRGVNWLGDAVMTTPALQRLREAMPAAHIALLTPARLADLWQHHPAINATISMAEGEGVWGIARKLRAESFDLALVLPNSPRSALEVFLARIPRRLGHARPWRNWFLTQCVPPRLGELPMRKRSIAEIKRLVAGTLPPGPAPVPATAHHLHQYLHLVAALGARAEPVAPNIEVTAGEVQDFQAQLLGPAGVDATSANSGPSAKSPTAAPPWFGLNLGAAYGPAKRWPLDRYVAVAATLYRQMGCGWLVLGGPEDVPLAREAVTSLRAAGLPQVIDLAGRTTLRQLCAALKLCRVVLTNDSGPMHLAAAVGTPVVAPFGSTSPELTAPGLPGDPPHRLLRAPIPCAPCFRRECPIDFRCMKSISVETMVQAAREAAGR